MRTEHEHHVRDPNNIVPGSLFLTGRVPASLSHEGWNFSRNFRTAEVVFSRRPFTQRPTTNGNFTCPNRERSLKRSCICILCFKLSQKIASKSQNRCADDLRLKRSLSNGCAFVFRNLLLAICVIFPKRDDRQTPLSRDKSFINWDLLIAQPLCPQES